jgi:hypothetical protein
MSWGSWEVELPVIWRFARDLSKNQLAKSRRWMEDDGEFRRGLSTSRIVSGLGERCNGRRTAGVVRERVSSRRSTAISTSFSSRTSILAGNPSQSSFSIKFGCPRRRHSLLRPPSRRAWRWKCSRGRTKTKPAAGGRRRSR